MGLWLLFHEQFCVLCFWLFVPAFLNNDFLILFDFTGLAHSNEHFICIFNLHYFIFGSGFARVDFGMKSVLFLFSLVINLILLSLFEVCFGTRQKLYLLLQLTSFELFGFIILHRSWLLRSLNMISLTI